MHKRSQRSKACCPNEIALHGAVRIVILRSKATKNLSFSCRFATYRQRFFASLRMTTGSLRMTTGSLRMTTGSLRMTTGSLRMTNGSPRMTTGSLRMTNASLRMTNGYYPLGKTPLKVEGRWSARNEEMWKPHEFTRSSILDR
ncbi:hypothetical protein HZA56_10500 [Candidatus Poribacteria bacterium]|nr:hypothetical protein [Candidatus Poribacteria bacterium]